MKHFASQEFFGNIGFGLRGQNANNGQINDLAIGNSPILYLTGTNPVLTGIVNSEIDKEAILFVSFNGTGLATLSSNDIDSLSNNRFDFLNDIILNPKENCTLVYDTDANKWRCFGISSSSGSFIGGPGVGASINFSFTAIAAQTTFALPSTPQDPEDVFVFVNGIKETPTNYSIVGSDLIFNLPLTGGEIIEGYIFNFSSYNVESYITTGASGENITDLSEWSPYADTAGNNPIDALGGSPNILWNLSSIDPISKTSNFELVKDAANRQGEGTSIPFTIEKKHLTSILQLEAYAELKSGIYINTLDKARATYSVTGNVCTVTMPNDFTVGTIVRNVFTSGGATVLSGDFVLTGATDTNFSFALTTSNTTGNVDVSYVGDLRISIIQDPLGTPEVIEPVGTDIQLAVVGSVVKILATFQTHASIRDYRLAIHVSGSTTNAFTVGFNDIRIWEQERNYGAIITDPIQYTPSSANSSYTLTSSDVFFHRKGNACVLEGRFQINTDSSTEFRLLLPNGYSVSNQITSKTIVGVLTAYTSAATWKEFHLMAVGGNNYLTVTIWGDKDSSNNPEDNLLANTYSFAGKVFSIFSCSIPIQGWGSNMALSSDAGSGRLIACRVYGNTASATTLTFPSVDYDSHNAYNSTTGIYTIPNSGFYTFHVYSEYSSTTIRSLYLRKTTESNLTYNWLGRSNYDSSSKSTFDKSMGRWFNSGDQIVIGTDNPYTGDGGYLTIVKEESGSQILARDEVVACSFYSSANQSSLTTQINFGAKVYDTHNAVTTGAGWRFTAPKSGKYAVKIKIVGSANINFAIYINGILFLPLARSEAGGYASGSRDLTLLKGEYIDVRPNSSSTVTGNVDVTNVDASSIEISSIG